MFESFFKERNVGETSWILSEPWDGENQDAGKRFNFRVQKPQALNESSNYTLCRLWVFHETDSKKSRKKLHKAISEAWTKRVLSLYCLQRKETAFQGCGVEVLRSRRFLGGVRVGFSTTLGVRVGFFVRRRLLIPSWINFYIILLNWEFLLKW